MNRAPITVWVLLLRNRSKSEEILWYEVSCFPSSHVQITIWGPCVIGYSYEMYGLFW
jgi:hypothetical protein